MNIVRLYNQNRKQLFILVLIVAFIILTIQFLNYLVKTNNEKNLNNQIISSSTASATTNYNSKQSAISSSSVSNAAYEKHSKVINQFMEYCNEGNTREAYNLLSTTCKEVMFPTLEYFINNYQKRIFSESRIYTIQNWTGSTYKINITENILATGKSNNGISIEDYFTIISENGESKLNINSFIGRTKLDSQNLNKGVEIQVLYKDTYMDYSIYTIKAINKTDKTILLDSGESTQNIYLLDKNNVKYMSYRNEIINAELKILPYSENELQIKYMIANISTRQLHSMIFKDIILDLNSYNDTANKKEYINRTSVIIEL